MLLSLASALALTSCRDTNRVPAPTFARVFPALGGDLMTISSPNLADLDGDAVPDIVFGTGVERVRTVQGRMLFTPEPEISGYVVAVSGATNQVLWKAANPRDAITTPRFARLNGDSVPDVIMGGREGVLTAFSGRDGAVLWRVVGTSVAESPFPYNFFTPAVTRDVNRDGVDDVVAVYGGNDTRMPNDARDPGYIALLSGADGAVLKVYASPDRSEMYASPVVYERSDGTEWVVIGTGGETHGGAAYRAPVASLFDGTFFARTERLLAPGEKKGVIAPPTLVDLNGDAELDIVIHTFDGRLVAVDGASGKALWQRDDTGEESYHSAAVVRMTPAGELGLMVSRGIGAFPKYVGSVHRLLDGKTGRPLYEYRDPNYPAGAPLAVDISGDGVDEPMFFSVRFPSAQGARIHILHRASGKLITHDIADNFWSTPVIADLRGTGTLELIGLSWRLDFNPDGNVPAWRNLHWELLRMDLSAATPASRSWAGYMGTGADGRYRPHTPTDRQ